jgi:signal transduction histidine kinase/DNA-binding response OmpR family regulator
LSIARSVQVALLGLTIVLTTIAGLGVAALYSSRTDYEDRLAKGLRIEAAGERLLAAAVVEEATLRNAGRGARAARARGTARRAFNRALTDVTGRVDDLRSEQLLGQVQAAQAALREAGPRGSDRGAVLTRQRLADLRTVQERLLDTAHAKAQDSSRTALVAIVAGGGLALAGALALVAALLAAVRRPLDQLVAASGRVARGDLSARVDDRSGPDELQMLSRSFNAMATDLERAQQRLETERRRLDVTVRSLGDGLILVDPDGHIGAVNPRAAALVPGIAPGQAPEDAGLPLPSVDEAAADEVLVDHDDRVLAVTAARLDEAGQPGGVAWTLRDVTERTRLERLKSEFVATASHELRSPLTSIKGFVELLAASEGLDVRQREFLDIVSVSTNRLVDLVNDLLDVARLEAGRVEVHRRPVEVGEVVVEVCALLRQRIEDKGQRLVLDVAPDTPRALADPARLRQVLVNLLTNAHLYTDADGTIAVRTAASPSGVRLQVSDTGRGMSSAELEDVFERFSRGAGAGSIPGTGLGLSIVKSLVDLHGGTVDVSSTLGQGTTFTISLPAAPAAGEIPHPRDALIGRRVLVLDDEPEAGRLIAERLLPFGVVAEVVQSGAEALHLLRSGAFDALTLDVLMPGMSGFEVLRELRADPALADLPVVVVSVFSGREALSGEWVVSKPIDAEELADALGAAVMAGRVRVLAVGRPIVRVQLAAALEELAIDHEWAATPLEAARLCARRRFEVALVDAGLPDAEAAIAGLELRGRRLRRSVVVINPGDGTSPGLVRLDAEPVPLEDAGATVAALLDATPATDG